jgi:hypothetical protein
MILPNPSFIRCVVWLPVLRIDVDTRGRRKRMRRRLRATARQQPGSAGAAGGVREERCH